jgi:hypothetical protein
MQCNTKLIDVLRYLETVKGVLRTCTQGTVWIIKGDETVNLRKEGVLEICDNLTRCCDLIQEALTENESRTQDN